MPVVITYEKFRIYIFTNDHEPAHVHAYSPKKLNAEAHARIEIETGRIIESFGFTQRALKMLSELVLENKQILEEKWEECQRDQ